MTDEKETYEKWNNQKLNRVKKLDKDNEVLKTAVKILKEQLKDAEDLVNR